MTPAGAVAGKATSSRTSVEGIDVFRVAIVGCGPRGLYCLDELAFAHTNCSAKKPLRITVYEPAPMLGAGSVYDPNQPEYLRMNFAAEHINAWSSSQVGRLTGSRLSFLEWLEQKSDKRTIAASSDYVPRAWVGRYLNDCYHEVLASLPEGIAVERITAKVDSIEPHLDRWNLTALNESHLYDAVLVTTGHGGWRSSPWNDLTTANVCNVKPDKNRPSDRSVLNRVKVIPAVFPVAKMLSQREIDRDSHVLVRGFGLTAIDAVLALTEGRGGRFETSDPSKPANLCYSPSGEEPAQLTLISRTGRPMLAKPSYRQMKIPSGVEALWESIPKHLNFDSMSSSSTNQADLILERVLKLADETLLAVTGDASGCGDWFNSWCRFIPDSFDCQSLLQQSLDVAMGRQTPGPAWAVGEAWRRLYPAIVAYVSHGGLRASQWPLFLQYAREMERIAFGPPAENVARIVSLIESGRLSICTNKFFMREGESFIDAANRIRSSVNSHPIVLNAVLPSPVEFGESSPINQLLQQGVVRRQQGSGAIEVSKSGQAISPAGEPSSGLSILGRATEGCVLGNDTLSRALHCHPSRWAEMTIKSMTSSEVVSG